MTTGAGRSFPNRKALLPDARHRDQLAVASLPAVCSIILSNTDLADDPPQERGLGAMTQAPAIAVAGAAPSARYRGPVGQPCGAAGAIVDPTDGAAELAAGLGVPHYRIWRVSTGVAGVILATPTALHAAQALDLDRARPAGADRKAGDGHRRSGAGPCRGGRGRQCRGPCRPSCPSWPP